MNSPTIVRTMLEPPPEEAAWVGSEEPLPRFSGVFSPADALMLAVLGLPPEAAASAVAACVSVRAPTIRTPRVSVSDLFIEGDSEGESSQSSAGAVDP